MNSDRRLIRAREVADLLDHPIAWFYRHKRRLIENHGFPGPIITNKWDPVAIDRWLDNKMPAHLRPAANDDADAGKLARMRRDLDAAAERMGGEG